jgi:hypothetical protein
MNKKEKNKSTGKIGRYCVVKKKRKEKEKKNK